MGLTFWQRQLFLRTLLFVCFVGIGALLVYFFNPLQTQISGLHVLSFSAFLLILFCFMNKDALWHAEPISQPFLQTVFFSGLGIVLFVLGFATRAVFGLSNYSFITALTQAVLLYLASTCLFLAVFTIDFAKKYWRSLAVLFVSLPFFVNLVELAYTFWFFFSSMVARGSGFLLHLFFTNTSVQLNSLENIVVRVNDFSVVIGAACSGLDSLVLFFILFITLLAYQHDVVHKTRAVFVGVLGFIGAFLVNILRVTALIALGTHYPDFAINGFHSNAGWILFTIYFVGFVWLTRDWILKKNEKEVSVKVMS